MPAVLVATRSGRRAPGVLLGAELKKILKVQVGDRINVVSPLSQELGPSGPLPKARSFRVAGVFFTGMYEYDAKSIYVTLPAAQEFLGMPDAVSGIALRVTDIDKAGAICERIEAGLGGYPYKTRTWYDMNQSLFSALKMEKVAMFLVLIIVILVSAFGIVSTLIMLVWEKVKEIAILKSMGATGDGVMKIFMVEGIAIGLVGTLLGVAVGWAACLILQKTGIQLNQDVYYIEALPVNIDLVEFALIAGIALHISFIATIYPSRRASRLRPVEGLRYD
jgi:lipoprotein-releasing system permease protein